MAKVIRELKELLPYAGVTLLEYHVPGHHRVCKRLSMMPNSEGELHKAKYNTRCHNN